MKPTSNALPSSSLPGGTLPPLLLVDDSSDDLFLLRRRLTAAGIKNPICVCTDGTEAIEFLEAAQGPAASREKPCAIFLDLRMPRCGGFEVLRWIREHPAFSRIRVYVVSTSDLQADQTRSQELGAARFLPKYPLPEVLAELVAEAMRAMHESGETPPREA